MQSIISKIKFATAAFVVILAVASCNKEFEDIPAAIVPPSTATGTSTINDIINNDTTFSYFKALVARAGTAAPTTALSNPALRLTAFIPNNAAFRLSGVPSAAAVTAAFTVAQAAAITNYVVTPQLLRSDSIPTRFANLMAPTFLNPTAGTPAFNPFVSLSIFPSRRATAAWVNNVPLVGLNVNASNGVIHVPATLVVPPSATLWSRITSDPDMTFFRAAVTRGDTNAVGTARIDSILNLAVGPNLTVFVPTNASMQALLVGQITQALVAQGVPPATAQAQATALAATPAVFSNPALYPVLTAQVVKGIVVYHILGERAFSVNLPATTTLVPTLLNTAVPVHPGVAIAATFGGPVVTAATVKGLANPTASNILINPLPGGTSDQLYTNGVLHKIDQVLRPQ